MFEGKRRYHGNSCYKSYRYFYAPKNASHLRGHIRKAPKAVIETILDDSNKENEVKTINRQPERLEPLERPKSPGFSLIDVSVQCLKEAFYFPKKLAKIYQQYALPPKVNEVSEVLINTQPNLPKKGSSDKRGQGCKDEHDVISREHYGQGLRKKLPFQYTPVMNSLQPQRKPIEMEDMRIKDNTEILSIKIKVNDNQYAICKIRRFDDLFQTIKIFCEINQIDSELIRPMITEVFLVLNSIYAMMNTSLSDGDIQHLGLIRSVIEKE